MRSDDMTFVYREVSDLPADAFSDSNACFWRLFESGRFADEGFCEERAKQVFRRVEGRSRVPAKRLQQTSAEPLACFFRRAMRCSFKVLTQRSSGRTSALTHSLPRRSATSSGDYTFLRRTPNQALQPTHMLVTDRADARSAPSIRVADL